VAFGRLEHRMVRIPAGQALDTFIQHWRHDHSPGWDAKGIGAWLRRLARSGDEIAVLFLEGEHGVPRERSWDHQLGFEQLMQGRDQVQRDDSYPGDRNILPGVAQIQVHHVQPRGRSVGPFLALGAYVPARTRIVRRRGSHDG
jgi:hypothetical protein